MSKPKKIVYSEPADFFPKEILKKYGLGEYNKEAQEERKKREAQEANKRIRDFVNDK